MLEIISNKLVLVFIANYQGKFQTKRYGVFGTGNKALKELYEMQKAGEIRKRGLVAKRIRFEPPIGKDGPVILRPYKRSSFLDMIDTGPTLTDWGPFRNPILEIPSSNENY